MGLTEHIQGKQQLEKPQTAEPNGVLPLGPPTPTFKDWEEERPTRVVVSPGSSPDDSGDSCDGDTKGEEPAPTFEELCNDGERIVSTPKAHWIQAFFLAQRRFISGLKMIYLYFFTKSLPTNFLMLTFRTYNRDFNVAYHNNDYLAELFRDAVMPTRGALHRAKSWLIRINRFFIEFPLFGIPGIVNFVDCRTQWFDEGVKKAMNDGFKQVVIIAAGYDTRAYRLHRPGVKFFEVDLPHASELKEKLVADLLPDQEKHPRPTFVAADLSKVRLADALAKTSFDPSQKTFFMAEGLVYYLPPGAVKELLTSVTNSAAPGSRFLMDFMQLSVMMGLKWQPGYETLIWSVWNKGEKMYSGIDERPERLSALLGQFGFKLQQLLTAPDLVSKYYHRSWRRGAHPIVSPYFNYLAAEKPLKTSKA